MPFNKRAKKMILGRKTIWSELEIFRKEFTDSPVVWFHAASVGEFEQARPLIEKLREEKKHIKIVLTFFSPSGYDQHQFYGGAHKVLYLPFDFPSHAEKFVHLLRPSLAVFVKYEFWLNFIGRIHKSKIPLYLIAAVFHENQPFFRWYGKKFRDSLSCFDFIFVQDKKSEEILKTIRSDNYMICGDTRYDRVYEIFSNPVSLTQIEKFTANAFVMVAGSSYEMEEKMLLSNFIALQKIRSDVKLILVPHHVDAANIQRVINLLHHHRISFSRYSEGVDYDHRVLLVDTMGLLSNLYRWCNIAVIGGGFHSGIHSILEPAVFGLPVLFGPNYKKFNEAIQFLDMQTAFVFTDAEELNSRLMQLITDTELYNDCSRRIKRFTSEQCGATEKILNHIQWPV